MSRDNSQGKKRIGRAIKTNSFVWISVLILLLCAGSVITYKVLHKKQEQSGVTGSVVQIYDRIKVYKPKNDEPSKNKAQKETAIVAKDGKALNNKISKNKTSNNTTSESKTSKGYTIVTRGGVTSIDGIKIVNKTYSVPSNYGRGGLTPTCEQAFKNMQKDMKALNMPCKIISGFRSYAKQKEIYNRYVRKDGKTNADRYSARPGHSEHHLGECLDVNSLYQSFGTTPEGKWIANNCWKYGFIIRYPKGKEYITGYMYEPWHIRYVGKTLAKKLYNGGAWITLEEYFGITSRYKDQRVDLCSKLQNN